MCCVALFVKNMYIRVYLMSLFHIFDVTLVFSASQYRSDLENHVVDAATTSEAVGFITLMQELKRKLRSWEQQVEVYIIMYTHRMAVYM